MSVYDDANDTKEQQQRDDLDDYDKLKNELASENIGINEG